MLGDLAVEDLPALYEERRAVPMPAPVAGVQCADLEVSEVPLRAYHATGHGPTRPCLFAIHGGGFIVGSNLMDGDVLAGWARDLGCAAVSVDYRLAPEAPYPAAIDDCEAALLTVIGHATEVGVDPTRIVLYGISAGGALAAALALRMRRRDVPIAGLMLEAPTLDDRAQTPSRSWDVPIAGPTTVDLGWRAYLGDRHGRPDVPADAAPARSTDLVGFPPTFIAVGTVDTLHDEALDFGDRLEQAGADVYVRTYVGGTHGFASMAPTSRLARELRRDQTRWLAGQFRS